MGRVTWVACGLVWGIGLRRLGCGCGRRLVTGNLRARVTVRIETTSRKVSLPWFVAPLCHRDMFASHVWHPHISQNKEKSSVRIPRYTRQVKAYTAGAMRARDGRCGKLGRAPHMPRIASIITHKSSARVHVSFKISFAQRLCSPSPTRRACSRSLTHITPEKRSHTHPGAIYNMRMRMHMHMRMHMCHQCVRWP